MWLFAILVAVPILEIALFIQVGGAIGLWPTLAIVIATALAGTLLLRSQGIATLNRLRTSVSSGENPMNPIAHGALILVAGVLLLTPGFFTDAVGLSLMIPPLRAVLIKAGAARLTTRVFVHAPASGPDPAPHQPGGTTVDGDYVVIDETDEKSPKGNSGWTKTP